MRQRRRFGSHLEREIDVLRALTADAVVNRLRPLVVRRRLPLERARPMSTGTLAAGFDERFGDPTSAGGFGNEQVVHDADTSSLQGGPAPEDRGEAHRGAA